MALLGAANIKGVPALGFPKISNLVGRIFNPTFPASPLWSISANTATPFVLRILVSASTVCWTECLLGLFTIPLFEAVAINLSPTLLMLASTETFREFLRSYQ